MECDKITYTTEREAKAAALVLRINNRGVKRTYTTYRCDRCKYYHIATNRRQEKRPKQTRESTQHLIKESKKYKFKL